MVRHIFSQSKFFPPGHVREARERAPRGESERRGAEEELPRTDGAEAHPEEDPSVLR